MNTLAARMLATVAAICLTPSLASAATITVTGTTDAVGPGGGCGLREAIQAANTDAAVNECGAGAGADTIAVPAGVFVLTIAGAGEDANATGDLDVLDPLTISGAGAGLTTIDAAGIDRVLHVPSNRALTVDRLTITGGRTPDGANGTLGARNGAASASGGGISAAGPLTVTDSEIARNATGNGGDGVSETGATGVSIIGGAGGAAGAGGGIDAAAALTLLRSSIHANRTGRGGAGGAAVGGPGAPAGAGSAAGGLGGGANGGFGGAGGRGGGVLAQGATTITETTFTDNAAGAGGASGSGTGGDGGTGGDAGGSGGAGRAGGSLSAGAGGSGGGIHVFAGASATVIRSTFTGNSAGRGGHAGTGTGGRGGNALAGQFAGGPGGTGLGGLGGDAGQGGAISGDFGAGLTVSGVTAANNVGGVGGNGGPGVGGEGGNAAGTEWGGTGGDAYGGEGGAGGDGGGILSRSAQGASITNSTVSRNEARGGGDGGAADAGDGGAAGPGGFPGRGGSGGGATGGNGGRGGSGGQVHARSGTWTLLHLTVAGDDVFAGGAGGPADPGVQGPGPGAAGAPFFMRVPGVKGATGTGPAIAINTATVTLRNSVVTGPASPLCTGPITDGGNNLGFPDASCTGTVVSPQLGPLQSNGGPTPTRALSVTSPAIGTVPAVGAGCPLTDQRGVARPVGAACDAGAYEFAPPVATTAAASAVAPTRLTLAGAVNPNGRPTAFWFEYGADATYGQRTPAGDAGSGVGDAARSAVVEGLTPSTSYHYRLVAQSPEGSSAGADQTATTTATPDPTPEATATATVTATATATATASPAATPAVTATPAPPPPDRTAPALSRVAFAPASFASTASLRFSLSETAAVAVTIERKGTGRRVGSRCVKQTRSNRTRRACVLYTRAATFTAAGLPGANARPFSVRIGTRRLAAGTYRATLRATDAARNASAPATATFTVRRR